MSSTTQTAANTAAQLQQAAVEQTIRTSKSLLWGISVAMSWMWGIGLFFSVQMAVQFGIQGLLAFATANAMGLALFGFHAQQIANRHKTARDFERAFFEGAKDFRGALFFYQLLAIVVTIFAVLKYLVMPIGINPALVCVVFLAAAVFLGEEFDISRIKFSHAFMFLGVFVSMAALLWLALPLASLLGQGSLLSVARAFDGAWQLSWEPTNLDNITYYLYYMVPVVVGLLLGPWLDLQQWQRAVQIRREGLSISGSFLCGSIIFFVMLLFHGILALAIWRGSQGGAVALVSASRDGLFHAKDVLTNFFTTEGNEASSYFGFYIAFVSLCALATADSGHIAIRWFLQDLVGGSKSIVFNVLKPQWFTSPLPWMGLCGVAALGCALLGFELEYIAGFYVSFLICYQVMFYRKMAGGQRDARYSVMKVFAISVSSIAMFGIGYFDKRAPLMAIAAVVPLLYGMLLTSAARNAANAKAKRPDGEAMDAEAVVDDAPAPGASSPARVVPGGGPVMGGAQEVAVAPGGGALVATGSKPVGSWSSTYFDGKWFVHTFTATYADTNSVGNVYFGTYGMWIGKTRELFFHKVLPEFQLATTDFFILTRSFEHKFLRESKEFENIEVRLKIADYNRKFATLEHQVIDDKGNVLGKGKQTLLFVSAKDYRMVDIPQVCMKAFLSYT
jgi:acyl-CoA thioesterase FadM